jgi:hypothetical protein
LWKKEDEMKECERKGASESKFGHNDQKSTASIPIKEFTANLKHMG